MDSSSASRWPAPWPIEPTILLLDEPLSALDAKIRVALRHEIRQIQRQLGITTVYVTHDQEEALELSDRIVVMSEGRIEQIGTPFEIYNFPATAFVASFVGTLNAIDGEDRRRRAGRLSLAGHEVRTTSALTGSDGQVVTVALRPEMIALATPDGSNVVAVSALEGTSGANRLPGTVVDVAFLGSVVRVRTTVGRTTTPVYVDTFNNPNLAVPPAGSPVVLSFPPEAASSSGITRSPDRTDALAAAEACCSRCPASRGRSTSTVSTSSSSTRTARSSTSTRCGAAGRSSSGARLEAAARRPVAPDVFAAIGFDPSTGRVAPGGPLATATMAGIEDDRRGGPAALVPERRRGAAGDRGRLVRARIPVALAVPLADLPALFDALRGAGRRIAVVTTDDRAPTDATLRALGVRDAVAAMVCGDDGFAMKPAPDPVFARVPGAPDGAAARRRRRRLPGGPRHGPRGRRRPGRRRPAAGSARDADLADCATSCSDSVAELRTTPRLTAPTARIGRRRSVWYRWAIAPDGTRPYRSDDRPPADGRALSPIPEWR